MSGELTAGITNIEADKMATKVTFASIRIMWLLASILLAYFSTVGGDEAVLAFWLFVVCTYPFSAIWWFYVYDAVKSLASEHLIVTLGLTIVIACAYLFWFIFVPKIFRLVRTKMGARS